MASVRCGDAAIAATAFRLMFAPPSSKRCRSRVSLSCRVVEHCTACPRGGLGSRAIAFSPRGCADRLSYRVIFPGQQMR
jgi:hypothetical protein